MAPPTVCVCPCGNVADQAQLEFYEGWVSSRVCQLCCATIDGSYYYCNACQANTCMSCAKDEASPVSFNGTHRLQFQGQVTDAAVGKESSASGMAASCDPGLALDESSGISASGMSSTVGSRDGDVTSQSDVSEAHSNVGATSSSVSREVSSHHYGTNSTVDDPVGAYLLACARARNIPQYAPRSVVNAANHLLSSNERGYVLSRHEYLDVLASPDHS